MSKFLDSLGLTTLWNIIKSTFASSLSFSNRTLTLKNKKGDTLSTVELPYRGIYFVKGTQTAATGTWTGNLPEVNSLYDGLTIAYFLPYAGSGNATLTLTLGTGTSTTTTQPEPVYYNNETRASTNYGKGSTVVLTWVSNATTGYEAVDSATGRWTRCDYNSNTVPSAYCTTAASTAAKAATCTNYYLLNNSYIHVLISQTNTAKSALTLNINSKGAKPIYINGTASSSTNYSLPTGTYIVFYDGTNYYFNTNGDLPGHINGSSITGTVAVAHGGTGQTSEKNAANAFINALDTETTALQDGDYFIAQTSGGGTTTTTYKRKTLSTLATYIGNSILDDYGFLVDKTTARIPAYADLDDYTTPGVYLCYSNSDASKVTNAPCKLAFSLVVLPISSYTSTTDSYHIQIVRKYLSNNTTYTYHNTICTWQRSEANGVWKPWTFTSGVSSITMPGLSNNTSTRYSDINFDPSTNGMGAMFHFVGLNDITGAPETNSTILQMNWDTSGGYDTQLAIGNTGAHMSFRGANGKNSDETQKWLDWRRVATVDYFTCDTASGTVAKNVTVNKTLKYYEGAEFIVKFTNGNTVANPTFSVNSLAARPIYLNGLPVPTDYIKSGDVVRFVYHDTSFDIIDRGLDTIKAYDNHVLYHIKCDSGNDNNDGLTENTAFKTLDKFFEVTANSGYTDCRCRLDQAGAYFLNKQAANNITWHCRIGPNVTSTSVPVRIVGNYGVEESWIMYNSHIKLSGRYPKDYKSTDTANIPLYYVGYNPGTLQGIYFENCAVTLENVIFDCTVRTFGCYINATKGLTANRLYLYGSDGIVEDLKIEATSNRTNPAIQVWRGSSIRFSSPNTNNTLDNSNKEFGVKSLSAAATDPKNIFLDIRDSSVVLASKMPQGLTNPYYFGIKCVNAELTGKRAVLGTFQTGCVAGQIAADEETELNVSWGEPAFNSIYGVESVQITTPENTEQIPANAIKTWTIEKATIQTAIKAAHSYSTFPYQILAIVPSFTSDNKVIIKNALEDASTGNVTVIGRNVSSSPVAVGATATVNILYTLKPLNIIKQS